MHIFNNNSLKLKGFLFCRFNIIGSTIYCLRLQNFLFPIQKFILLFFLQCTISSLQAQEIITLENALDRTLKNNLQIRKAGFQSALSVQDLQQSRMNLLPNLNGGVGGRLNGGSFFDEKTGILGNTTNKSVDGNLSSSVILFQGFQRVNQIAQNKYILEADKSNVEKVRYELQLSVFTIYLEGLTNLELRNASEQQLRLSKAQLEVEEIHDEVGNRTLADLAQAKSQVSLDELNVVSAQNAYDLSILLLKQMMEMHPDQDIVLESPEMIDIQKMGFDATAEDIIEQAYDFFPDIQLAQFNIKAAEQAVKIAKGSYFPTLSLSGGLGTGYTTSYRELSGGIFPFNEQIRNNFSQFVGLSLNIPIFNNFSSRIGVRKAKIRLEDAKVEELITKNSLSKVINQSVLDLRSSEKRYNSSSQAFVAMREAFKVIKERYDVGLANSIELSTAQTNMNKAEFDFITSKYNVVYRSKVIDYYLGRPIHL